MATTTKRSAKWSSIIDFCQVNIRQVPQYAAVSSIGDASTFVILRTNLLFLRISRRVFDSLCYLFRPSLSTTTTDNRDQTSAQSGGKQASCGLYPYTRLESADASSLVSSPFNDDNEGDGLLMHIALIDSTSNAELPCYYPIVQHTYSSNNGITTTQEFATETQPSLSGCLVSPAYKVQAEAGAGVRVCVFPEVRVWVCGVFKLKFTLYEKCG